MTPGAQSSQKFKSEEYVAVPLKHQKYFLSDGNVTFLVDGTLFRVHRFFLERHSDFFKNLFGQYPDYGTLHDPIPLDDCSSDHFASLLWVFYKEGYDDFTASKETWLGIMELTSRWKMGPLLMLAKKYSHSLLVDPVEMIAVQAKYKFEDAWALTAYVKMVERLQPISLAEGESMGMRAVIILSRARQYYRPKNPFTGLDQDARSTHGLVLNCIKQVDSNWDDPFKPSPSTLWPEVRDLSSAIPYTPTILKEGCDEQVTQYQTITLMPCYRSISIEELRVLDSHPSRTSDQAQFMKVEPARPASPAFESSEPASAAPSLPPYER